jgi:mono/diheme cytochrome c family protein
VFDVVLALATLIGAPPAAPPSAHHSHYGVARTARREEVVARDITVSPTGAGLPFGRGTADEGKRLYVVLCGTCHGEKGEGRPDYPALVGGRGSVNSAQPLLTVGSYWPYATTIWDYIRRAMPYVAPGTLKPDEVYALSAFLLYANGIIEWGAVLDGHSLPAVLMPNRRGFVADPRPDVP